MNRFSLCVHYRVKGRGDQPPLNKDSHSERMDDLNCTELSQCIELYGKAIYSFCWQLTKNQSDADDLYQETFLKATELRQRIDPDGNPKGFLFSITLRLWKDRRRKLARRQRIAPTEALSEETDCVCTDELTPEEIVLSHELCEWVWRAADNLPERYRVPLYLYYTADLSVEQIASALHIPQGTVKSRLHHARKAMKQDLEARQYERA